MTIKTGLDTKVCYLPATFADLLRKILSSKQNMVGFLFLSIGQYKS